jgi:hypothetical protein
LPIGPVLAGRFVGFRVSCEMNAFRWLRLNPKIENPLYYWL